MIPSRTHRPLAAIALVLTLALPGCQSIPLRLAKLYTEPGPVEVADDIEVVRDIAFGETPSGPLLLDLYRPAERSAEPLPVIVFVHGGGWFIGNKHQVVRVDGQLLARDGYAIVSTAYRLSNVATFPAQVHDVKAAIRWVRANADRYGLDTGHIGAWGGSAGGHLVAMLGTTSGVPSLEGDVGGDALRNQSSRVQAVVNFFGISNVETWADPIPDNPVEMSDPSDMVTAFLGGPVAEKRVEARAASPIHYVDPTDAPFLHVHGDGDNVVPIQQSQALNAALQRAGVESTLHVVAGGGHGSGGEFAGDSLLDEVRAFFDRHLKE